MAGPTCICTSMISAGTAQSTAGTRNTLKVQYRKLVSVPLKQTTFKVIERSHEAYANNHGIGWPNDESLACRNIRQDPLYNTLLNAGCVYQERLGMERPGWYATDGGTSAVLPYDWYGAYGHPKHEHYPYYDRLRMDYTFGFPKTHEIIGAECMACRNDVAVFNMSSFSRYYLTGPDSQSCVDWIFTSNLQKPTGSTVYTCMLNKFGGVETDLTVSVVEPGKGSTSADRNFDGNGFYITASGSTAQHVLQHMLMEIQNKKFNVQLDMVEDLTLLSIQGPHSRELLQVKHGRVFVLLCCCADMMCSANLFSTRSALMICCSLLNYSVIFYVCVREADLVLDFKFCNFNSFFIKPIVDCDLSDNAFPFSTNRLTSAAGHVCRILRLSFVGELGYELHIPYKSSLAVYNELMHQGRKFNVKNAGFRAIYSLSAEKGYRLWGADLRNTDTPLESALAFTCKLKSDVNFQGRQALEKQKKDGLKKKLACLTLKKLERS